MPVKNEEKLSVWIKYLTRVFFGFINQGLFGIALGFVLGFFADKKWSVIKNKLPEE